jgi:hypothetical protein
MEKKILNILLLTIILAAIAVFMLPSAICVFEGSHTWYKIP